MTESVRSRTEAGGLRHLCPLAVHHWWFQWEDGKQEGEEGAGLLVGAIPLSWLYLGPGLLVHPEFLQTGCREKRERVAEGQKGCGGALTRFPSNRSCERESKDQPGVCI